MSTISTEDIKQLRDATGISVMQCKKALEEADGDMEKARIVLQKKSAGAASKKADRELGAGIVATYLHTNNKIGVMVELLCETDFVAKNEEFVGIANDVAMHIAAMNPEFTQADDVPEETQAKITAILKEEVDAMDKPEDIKAKVLEGKVADYFKDRALLDQTFIKNPELTVRGLVEGGIQKLGEKIEIGRFARYSVE